MKALFVIIECESYAVGLFSSLLKKRGHEVHLVFDPKLFDTNDISNNRLKRFFDIRQNNVRRILEIKPDLIGFSLYTKDYAWSVEMARMIKEAADIPIIFGGIHCTLAPEEVIKEPCLDIVCVGEGEEALLELAEAIENKKPLQGIRNLWFKDKSGQVIKNELRPLIQDLNTLPFPDKDIFFRQQPIFKSGYVTSSGRGCPYSCTYCASGSLNNFYARQGLGRYVRQRSVANLIDELVQAKKKYNYKRISFTDDVFTLNTTWLRDFAAQYKKLLGVPFFCTANPGTIKDEELYLLKEANCHMIGFDLQSISEATRHDTLNRPGSNERIKRAAQLCHNLKLRFSFDHIFNIPGEGEKEQAEALVFYNESRPDLINTFWMTYFPNTKIIDIALEKGLFDRETAEKAKRGELSTSLNLGAGCDYSLAANNDVFDTFAFYFSLLPLMPKWFFRRLIRRKRYQRKLCVHFLLRLLIKDLSRIKVGRFSDVFFPIRMFLVNIMDNILIRAGFLKKG
jgi:radical SAM superfamily enzyme YgiQ (UPF0313 family)